MGILNSLVSKAILAVPGEGRDATNEILKSLNAGEATIVLPQGRDTTTTVTTSLGLTAILSVQGGGFDYHLDLAVFKPGALEPKDRILHSVGPVASYFRDQLPD